MSIFQGGSTKNSAYKVGEEGVDYVTYKDGNGTPIKLLNLNHEKHAPFEGIVELEPTRITKSDSGNYRHIANASWKVIRDKETGYLVGIPLGINPETKEVIWQTLSLVGKETLDLSIPDQRNKWVCIKYSHLFVDSPNFRDVNKMSYKAFDKEAQNEINQIQRKTRRKAQAIADALFGEELFEMAVMLGFDPNTMSTRTLENTIIDYVENPNKIKGGKTGAEVFLDIYTSESRDFLSVLRRGMATGIIEQNVDRGIHYNGTTLGYTENEALVFLRENPSIKTSIDLQAKGKQKGTEASSPKPKMVMDEKDAKIAVKEKEIEELRRKLSELSTAKADKEATEFISSVDPELADLIAEAKTLDVKGAHNYKDKEKLRKAIADVRRRAEN